MKSVSVTAVAIELWVNGERRSVAAADVRGLVALLGLDPAGRGLAVEGNGEVVPRSAWAVPGSCRTTGSRSSGPCGEHGRDDEDHWELAGHTLELALLLGTARYPSRQVLLDALAASGTEFVTVACGASGSARAPTTSSTRSASGLDLLPNTAGCFTAATPCSLPSSAARRSGPTS